MARAIQTRGGDRDTPASWSIRTIRQSNRSCSEDSKKARSTVWNCRRASRRWSGSKKKESGDITAEHRYLAIHRTWLTARFPLRFGRKPNEIGHLPGRAVPVLVSRSRSPILISVWNGMGRCNPADCNHHVSFRMWHFLCKRTRLSEARRRAGILGRNSRLGLAMFPGSDALLSCNHYSNAGSAWLLNIAQEGSVEVDAESLSCVLFSKLCNFGQTRGAATS